MQDLSQNSTDSSEVRGSHQAEPAPPTTTRRRNSRLIGRLNLIVAVLVVAALLGSFLLVFSIRQHGSSTPGSSSSGLPNFTHLYLVTAGADGLTNKVLFSIDPSNGQVTWQRKIDNLLDGYGISVQGNLYLPAQDGNVYAFRGSNGQPLWHTSMSHSTPGYTSVWLLAYQNLIIDGITRRTNDLGDLYALNTQTGAVVWHTSLSCANSPSNDCRAGGRLLLLANGIIYGLAEDGLSAWNAANGHFLWRNPRYQLNGQPQSIVVSHGKVYITNFYPEVDVLDASSGSFIHSLRPPEPSNSGAVVYDIAATENTVYVLGGHTISAYRASDDSLMWKQAFAYHFQGTIYAGRDGIYVNYYDISMGKAGTGSLDNILYALRPGDGSIIWQQQFPDGGNGLYPIEFNGVICFSGLNNVYGLRVSDGLKLWQFSHGRYIDGLFAG